MIRYKIDVWAALKAKGINHTTNRKNNYFGQRTIAEIKQGKVVGVVSLDTLCRLLEIQPGDLLEYVPDPPETASAKPEEPTAEDIF